MIEIKKLSDIRLLYNEKFLNNFLKYSYGININMITYLNSLIKFNYKKNIKLKEISDQEIMFLVNNIIIINLKFNKKLNFLLNIENLRRLKTYKYLRHINNLPVNGQRTHTNRKTKKKYFSFLNKTIKKHIFKI
jgi:small subunit ribosomal protein S13